MNSSNIFALKGNIIFTKSNTQFTAVTHGYIVSDGAAVVDVYEKLPERSIKA